ncbi:MULTISPECIES: hypothetical protein [Streptomyces]|uniref:hypothetical protein n=1 Tax=Streptomyces TaxID=1883 RepID=UPI0004BDBF5D|nr:MULTISPECIES: hypothetical protein [Streptomyces]KOU14965.1 membrane protein [Streptomyces sp. WM6349]KOU80737.1 membrane protein [Streptomyces sp. XY593]KOU89951.1 membrane protein [Streptomyces sp. XY533]KOV14184.1 membrane protein [Streptomyces sp. XY511]KOV41306.1 membrane protein [Streptomyces sp. H036]
MAVQTTTAPGRFTFQQIAIGLQTLALLFQAVTAGLLLSTSYGELLHGVGARVMYGASMLYVLAAVLAWRPGGGSPRPVLHASGFLALASLQVVLGIARMPGLHVPLGVVMFALSVLALHQALSTRPAGTAFRAAA